MIIDQLWHHYVALRVTRLTFKFWRVYGRHRDRAQAVVWYDRIINERSM